MSKESDMLRVLAAMQRQLDTILLELAITKEQVIAAHAQILRNRDDVMKEVPALRNYYEDAERARRKRP